MYIKPQTPDELHQKFALYLANKDLSNLITLFHEDSILVIDKSGNYAKGRNEIKKVLNEYLKGDVKISTEIKTVHINNDIALVQANWEIPNLNKGVSLEVLKYIDNGWVYLIDNPYGL